MIFAITKRKQFNFIKNNEIFSKVKVRPGNRFSGRQTANALYCIFKSTKNNNNKN